MNIPMTSIDRPGGRDMASVTPTELPSDTEHFVLRRHGQRPLVFEGSELAMASSYMAGSAAWYELNIYRTVDGAFVVRVHMYANDPKVQDMTDAWSCPGFSDLLDTIESWDAARTVPVELCSDESALSIGDMASRALSVKAKVEDARRQYKMIVGELLMDLDG